MTLKYKASWATARPTKVPDVSNPEWNLWYCKIYLHNIFTQPPSWAPTNSQLKDTPFYIDAMPFYITKADSTAFVWGHKILDHAAKTWHSKGKCTALHEHLLSPYIKLLKVTDTLKSFTYIYLHKSQYKYIYIYRKTCFKVIPNILIAQPQGLALCDWLWRIWTINQNKCTCGPKSGFQTSPRDSFMFISDIQLREPLLTD